MGPEKPQNSFCLAQHICTSFKGRTAANVAGSIQEIYLQRALAMNPRFHDHARDLGKRGSTTKSNRKVASVNPSVNRRGELILFAQLSRETAAKIELEKTLRELSLNINLRELSLNISRTQQAAGLRWWENTRCSQSGSCFEEPEPYLPVARVGTFEPRAER
jgi:hypothetical protein